MAAPSNRFEKVGSPVSTSVTVTIRSLAGSLRGEVVGPDPDRAGGRAVTIGQDGSLSPLQALAIGCHMANELARDVVIVDLEDRWEPAWGRLDA